MDILLTTANFFGHFLIGFFFVFFGAYNIFNWKHNVGVLAKKGIPSPTLVLVIASCWQFIAGLMIIAYYHVQLAALSLIIFTLLIVMVFHCYWTMDGEKRSYNMLFFIINLTITLGALLLLL